jgi:hypothetical protein
MKVLCTPLFFVFLAVFALVSVPVYAGEITSGQHTSQFPYFDSNADTIGDKLNWRTSFGTPVEVTNTQLTGEVWGEGQGWIRLDPSGAGVENDGNGVLSGYAWGDHAGWISFNCLNDGDCATNGNFHVAIDPLTGNFNGFAWSENFGWIEFACPGATTCVNTSWRPGEEPPGEGAQGSKKKAQCDNGIDDDNDGLVDGLDSGCSSSQDTSEFVPFISPTAPLTPLPAPQTPGSPLPIPTPQPTPAPLLGNFTLELSTSNELTPVSVSALSSLRVVNESRQRDYTTSQPLYEVTPGNEFRITLTSTTSIQSVYSYIVRVGTTQDMRETLNESHSFLQRFWRLFVPAYAQAQAISDRLVYEKISPNEFRLVHSINDKEGVYEMHTVALLADGTSSQETTVILVQSEGQVFRSHWLFAGEHALDAEVMLYEYASSTGEKTKVSSKDFANPKQAVDGKYSYIVPAGSYVLEVNSKGYVSYTSDPILASEDGHLINYKIELVCKFFSHFSCAWDLKVLLIVLFSFAVYVVLRKRGRSAQ